jgi:hypothetical protein
MHFGGRIADDGFVNHADAETIQGIGEPERVGVLPVRREKFGTYGNDLCIHL